MSNEERADGSLRVVYGASICSCRPCPLREQCQWNGSGTKKPRQVSVLLHPLDVRKKPLFWFDWSRRVHRQACIHLLRSQRVEIQVPLEDGTNTAAPSGPPRPLSRAARAHVRLSWASRVARNARKSAARPVTIKLCGVPEAFATFLGVSTA